MKNYIIKNLSPKQKHWSSEHGDFVTYFVRLEGEGDEAIMLNKKTDSPPPEAGQELYGELVETKFGKRFKSAKRADVRGGGWQKSPEEQESIARAVAFKGALEYHHDTSDATPQQVLETAEEFLPWLKGGKTEVYKLKDHGESFSTDYKATTYPVEVKPTKKDEVVPVDDKPFSLDEIPF